MTRRELERAIRLDRWLLALGAVIVLVVPVPFLLLGVWRFGGIMATDVVGFGLVLVVVVRGGRRALFARRLARASYADLAAAERSLDRTLEQAIRMRGEPRGPLS
jgi:hypothetical protein